MTDFSAHERLVSWYRDSALPLWIECGYDHQNGGFFESLDFEARPIIGQRRRVRVQARQIHTMAQAAKLSWHPDAEALAQKGFDYFLASACPDGGSRGCVHHLSDDGTILDDRRDLYDQAFLLLSCASMWDAFSDDRAIALAKKTTDFLDVELAAASGGWAESDRRELPRRQNPHMHLLEAFIALYRTTNIEQFGARARHIAEQLFPRFYDEKNGVLREFFLEDLSIDESKPAIEPGHLFEWVWLLDQYAAIDDTDSTEPQSRLFENARKTGLDASYHGFANNKIIPGRDDSDGSKRLWPQTEYLKAVCVMAINGNVPATNLIKPLIDALFKTYLAVQKPGLWIDEFDANGTAISKDVPASILYHLFEAIVQTERHQKSRDQI